MAFKKFSKKQILSFIWWRLNEFKNYRKIICSGAIRTGKTDIASRGFMDWSLATSTSSDTKMKGWNKYFIVAQTKDSAYDNVVEPMTNYLKDKGWIESTRFGNLGTINKKQFYVNKANGYLYVRFKGKIVQYKFLGCNNARSFVAVQGRTYRGGFIDEGGLMNIKMIETLEGRCATWKDSKIFMCTNPEGNTQHEFYKTYIEGANGKNTLVMKYHLLDNPIFTEEDVEYYKKIFSTAMFKQKVEGEWVLGTGGTYKKYNRELHVVNKYIAKAKFFTEHSIGIDTGYNDATAMIHTGFTQGSRKCVVLNEYHHRNGGGNEKAPSDYMNDLFTFIENVYNEIGKQIHLFIESADKGFRLQFNRELATRKFQSGEHKGMKISRALVDAEHRMWKVKKSKIDPKDKKQILGRVNCTDMMFGANVIEIASHCKQLISEIEAAHNDDKGDRKDDWKGGFPIDSLNAFEYSAMHKFREIQDRIIRRKV